MATHVSLICIFLVTEEAEHLFMFSHAFAPAEMPAHASHQLFLVLLCSDDSREFFVVLDTNLVRAS